MLEVQEEVFLVVLEKCGNYKTPGAEGLRWDNWYIGGCSGYYRYKINDEDYGTRDNRNHGYFQYCLGGCHSAGLYYRGSDGGTGGQGGVITVSNLDNIHAYNGYFKQEEEDTETKPTELTECVIYAQLGYSLDDLNKDQIPYKSIYSVYQRYNKGNLHVARISDTLEYANNAIGMINYLGTNYRSIDYSTYTIYKKIGIGSGAGFHEISNGTLTVK